MSPNATTIDLALVEKFLFDRKALMALDGAPFANVRNDAPYEERGRMFGLDHKYLKQCVDFGFVDVASSEGLVLYVGTGDVCPAAEGWAAHVLALLLDVDHVTHLEDDGDLAAFNGSRLQAQWCWRNASSISHVLFRERPIVGKAPSTPAERLRAVLLYELERAR